MKRKTFRKKITTEETLANINPKNKKLVEKFLKFYATRRSATSVKVYKSNYDIFFSYVYLYLDNKFYIDLKKYEILEFFDYALSDLQWSPNRYAQMHSSLSSLSEWIENYYDEEYPQYRNLIKKIEKVPKELVRAKTVLSEEEVKKLMKHLEETGKTQQCCFLALCISSGCRISEYPRITTDLIDENNTAFDDIFLETISEIKTKGRGSNGKLLKKYIIKDTFLPYYKKWLSEREEIMKSNNQEHNSIFINKDGSPASTVLLNYYVEQWSEYLKKPIYVHCFRHYFTTYLSLIGLEKELIQAIIGWSSDALVDLYNDSTVKDKEWKSLGKLKSALNK